MDGLPVDNLMCNDFYEFFVSNSFAEINDVIKGRNIYSQQGAFILCIENDRLGKVLTFELTDTKRGIFKIHIGEPTLTK